VGPALSQLAEDFSADVGIPTHLDCGDVIRIGVPEADLVLFRVAQLALPRADEHSAVSMIDLRLRRRGSRVTLTIRCDSTDLPATLRPDGHAERLMEMGARLRSVGGRLAVRSSAQIGTVISATVPSLPFSPRKAATPVPA
jgi:signal transduction histidine kinase